ncbi:MAG: sigma-70 family RNA polymerase sigma factor [Opitutales bacterium]
MDNTNKIKDTPKVASYETEQDVLLMRAVQEGDDGAFRILVQKWKNPLVNFFYKSLSDAHISEDLTQQVFINLYKARENYQAKAKFSTYLFYIARRILINNYRSNKNKPLDSYEYSHIEQIAVERNSKQAELEEIFEKVVLSLPEKQRTAILLLKQQELSYEEIAKAMNAGITSVKTWIHRARTTLRQELKKYDR